MTPLAAPTRHPSDAVLLDHVSGTLSIAHHLVVATHAAGCSTCGSTISEWEQIGGAVLEGWPAAAPPRALLERCLATIDAGDMAPVEMETNGTRPPPSNLIAGVTLPASLQGLRAGRARRIAPGIRHNTLWRDDRGTLHLIHVKAGVSLPAHTHRGLELTCVLSGAFHDGGGRYAVGDVTEEEASGGQTAREGQHRVVADPPEDCVCIMATTGRLRFSGWIARALQPVMPF